MILFSDIVKGAFQLLGRPSLQEMPYLDILKHAGDVVNGRLLDTSLMARNRRLLQTEWIRGTDRTMWLSEFDMASNEIIPVKVESRIYGGDADARPSKLEVVAYEQLDDMGEKALVGETYCSFYANDTMIAFSELETEIENKEYRITYEPLSLLSTVAVVTGTGHGTTYVGGDGVYTPRGTSSGKTYYNLTGQADSTTVHAIYYSSLLTQWKISGATTDIDVIDSSATYPYDITTTWNNGALVQPGSGALALTHNVLMNDIFLPLFQYETALRSIDHVENTGEVWKEKRERLRPLFLGIVAQEGDRFEKFHKTQYGNKKVMKQGFRTRNSFA